MSTATARSVTITIEGEPIPKGRPRFNRATGNTYTPKTTAAYEDLVAWYAATGHVKFAGHVSVTVEFVTGRKPDLDNCVKSILDGLQRGGMLVNDSQVMELHAAFVAGTEPRAVVTVTELA